MILYCIKLGVITPISVSKETKCGWRMHNNGFINRHELKGSFISLDSTYYTTDMGQAKQWQAEIEDYMYHCLQVSMASLSDLQTWEEDGSNELWLPKSRFTKV